MWLGHPLHPALAQLALGSFMSASLIDTVGGRRRESSGLIAVGLVSTVPTVAASVFRLRDGGVVHGPATAPVPGFESRVDGGVLQVRVRTLPGISAS